jgi:hypothetical protein
MCAFAHAEFHNSGRRQCERFWNVDLDAEAAATDSRWLAFSDSPRTGMQE